MNQTHAPVPETNDGQPQAVHAALVEELLRALSTAVRSHRLYAGQSATLDRFVATLGTRLRDLWEVLPLLRLEIEEQRIRWEGRTVWPTGGESGDLAFTFYKDGIRELTMLPGFEEEVVPFLGVLARAPQLRTEEDDLITLLWQEDLARLRYEYVEPAAEEIELSLGPPAEAKPLSPEAVRAEAAAPQQAALGTDDFRETLYFLDENEMRQLAEEVRKEAARDLWADLTSALFDRLEDGSPSRQLRVLHILQELLASALGAGHFERAAGFLRSLAELAARPGLFPPEVLREVRSTFDRLAEGETIAQLALALDENPNALRSDALASLLGFFPPAALAPLMRAVDAVTRPDVRRTFEQAIQRLAMENRPEVVRLLGDPDAGVVTEAIRWVGRLEIGSAVNDLMGMLKRPETDVRLAAIDALQQLRAATAGRVLQELLEDPSREIRIAAVKALSALEYAAARGALETAVTSKRLRAADRTEKVAFFEAFGRLAGVDGVALLDRTLNGRSWLGRGESPEIRACAALALGRVRHPSARAALSSAAKDSDPVVRSAVARALREEEA